MLNVSDQGNGPDLVFLHGFCEDRRIWETFAPLFQKNFRVLCIDLPGFGKSIPGNDDLSNWATACFEVLDSVNVQPFSLVGHSMGGYVALAMMEQAPERIRHFVSFHSSPLADTEEKKANRLRQVGIVKERGVSPFVNQLIPSLFKTGYDGPGINMALNIAREQNPEGITNALRAMLARPDRTPVVRSFEAPILILSGRHDPILPIDGQKNFAGACQKGIHSVLEESGHMGMLEEPTRSYDLINRFLKDNL